MANLLKGKEVSEAISKQIQDKISELSNSNITPTLAIFRVGEKDSDLSYERGILKKCDQLGISVKRYIFDENINEETFYKKLDEANNDNDVHGILVFRPLPSRFNDDKLRNFIKPEKDVDGCSDLSLAGVFTDKYLGYAPCTAEAALEILKYYNIELKSKNVAVLGRSLVIGKPVSMMLLKENATVTICHSKTDNIEEIASKTDILICATGKMESINSKYINNNQTIIDVGINYNPVKQKLCGDVLFEEVEPLVKNITPVPGGVGSVTTTILLSHVVNSAYSKINN